MKAFLFWLLISILITSAPSDDLPSRAAAVSAESVFSTDTIYGSFLGPDTRPAEASFTTSIVDPAAFINDSNYHRTLHSMLSRSSLVVEGTVRSVEVLKERAVNNTFANMTWYLLEDLSVIAGRYEQDVIPVIVDDVLGEFPSFTVGQRCIMILRSNDSVFYPDEEQIWESEYVRIEVDAAHPSRLSDCRLYGVEIPVHTKKAFTRLVRKAIGLPKDYYSAATRYVHSDRESAIRSGSDLIAEISVTEIKEHKKGQLAECTCTVKKALKGKKYAKEGQTVRIWIPAGSMELNRSYQIYCQRQVLFLDIFRRPVHSDAFQITSKKNSIIPL
ncbi:MAG: hypothetical protein II781_01595 [Clostridia bacterium]|nr:hypothetical protein [Clostridia bacterium]